MKQSSQFQLCILQIHMGMTISCSMLSTFDQEQLKLSGLNWTKSAAYMLLRRNSVKSKVGWSRDTLLNGREYDPGK